MSRFVIDATLPAKLLAAKDDEVVELTDASGKIVGRFIPRQDPSRYEIVGELASPEECHRRAREGKKYTAQEVEARLRSLDT